MEKDTSQNFIADVSRHESPIAGFPAIKTFLRITSNNIK